MGKKSKRVRTKQTEKEKNDAKKNVVSDMREAELLGINYRNNKQKKTLKTSVLLTTKVRPITDWVEGAENPKR